jgi:hypothetical protein
VSNLIEYAEAELDRAGLGEPDADYNGKLKTAVLDIIQLFSSQGHSGLSAAMVTDMVARLMNFEPLTPLTGEPDEWVELNFHPDMAAQNKRYSSVFRRADGTAYDINARRCLHSDGSTSSGGRVPITFPYAPTVEYVKVTDVDIDGDPT